MHVLGTVLSISQVLCHLILTTTHEIHYDSLFIHQELKLRFREVFYTQSREDLERCGTLL